ncbi:hypothetical protein U724_19020 [Pseudomonas chlororaphis subsp. aurantiaca PB-St2]|nr:hypothetical protein U724_19020 [Pseudomonas chlororaphis subsp. aurantiaca PB-St2]
MRLFGPLLAAQGFAAKQLERPLRHRRGRTAAKARTKAQPNDADRLRKYLARFGLEWKQIVDAAG